MNKKAMPRFKDEFIKKLNSDKTFLSEFVNTTFEDYNAEGDLKLLITSLRYIIEVRGGVSAIANKTGLSRQTIHNIFKSSEPRFTSLSKIINALGFDIKITPKENIYL